jgi:hypothetical protein
VRLRKAGSAGHFPSQRADVSYEQLAERLREHGLEETEGSISNKLSRTFPVSCFFAVMKAIGVDQVRMEGL